MRATLEFFESDKATVKLLLRDPYALGERFEKHLGGIYERFIDDIETFIVAAQERGEVVTAPPRMVAYTLAALVGSWLTVNALTCGFLELLAQSTA